VFICANCKRSSKPRTSMTFVPVETREISYPFRKDANVRKVGGRFEKRHDKGGHGHETVVEMGVCPKCAKEMGE